MADANADIPNIKIYEEGEPIPSVDPEDIKSLWHLKPPWRPGNDQQSACSPGADIAAVFRRSGMIETLNIYNLLTPWQHGEELHDAVFRIAATFPIRELKHRHYKIEGDERYGFDPNAFVQQLVDETGIAHVWEPVRTKIGEGGRSFSMSVLDNSRAADPDREAKHKAREVMWMIWKRFAPQRELMPHLDKENAAHMAAVSFADFLIDNIELVCQVEDGFIKDGCAGLDLLKELEQKAQKRA